MDSQEVKEALGERAKEIILNGLGLKEVRGKVCCPLHADKKPSMSWYSDGLMWRCHACKGQIDIYTYLTDYENLTFVQAVDKVADMTGTAVKIIKSSIKYVLPNIESTELSSKMIKYMSKRKLTKETLDAWRVKERIWNGNPTYVFQYFDDKEQLIYVSYRGYGKGGIKGGCEENTKAILWGMWHIDKDKPLVITEGQPDAMAVWQAGYKNVVSVPNGSNNLKWIDHCWEWLQGVREFIVFADNDEPGKEMAENIKLRLKNVKVLVSDKCKDANEILYRYGATEILNMINETIKELPAGLIDGSEMKYETSMKEEETIETGFYEYDAHVEDWKMQELTVILGRNNEGKTTFVSQIITHCLEKGVTTFLYSGEMSDKKIQDWLYRQLIGENNQHLRVIKTKYGDKTEPKPEVIKYIKEWHRNRLYLYDRSAREVAGKLDKFFEVMRLAASRYGCKLFVIDNLMSILEENADSLYSDQANFIQRCKDFAIQYWVHIVLLTHPNKGKSELQNAQNGNLEKTDISGSNNIPNKADNIIVVERNWGNDREWDAIITSLKDRESGQRKTMRFNFSKATLRFFNGITQEKRIFSWEKKLAGTKPIYESKEEKAPWD